MTTPYVDPVHLARGHVEVLDRVFQVPTPAVGTDWSFTVPGHEAWEILAASFVLTASAVAATRVPSLVIDDETLTYFATYLGASPTLSQVQRFVASKAAFTPPTVAGAAAHAPLPHNAILAPGHRIRVTTTALDPGDQWSSIALLARVRTIRNAAAQLEFDQQYALSLAVTAVNDPNVF